MSEWISSEWFSQEDIVGTSAETGSLDGSVSGTSPDIDLESDYYLRDENDEIVTDQNGEPISLEGFSIA